MQIKKFLFDLDYFKTKFVFSFQNETTIKSNLGLLFTLISVGIIIAITIVEGNSFLFRTSSNINISYNYYPNIPNITLGVDYSFSFYSSQLKYLMDERFYITNIYNLLQTRNNSNNQEKYLQRIKLGIIECSKKPKVIEIFSKNGITENLFNRTNYNQHYCMNADNITIGGSYYQNYFSNIYLEIKRCVNSTLNNNHCHSDDEITNSMIGNQIEIYYVDSYPSVENFNNPLSHLFISYYVKLDPTMYFQNDIYFSTIKIKSDIGTFFAYDSTVQNYFLLQANPGQYQAKNYKTMVARIYMNVGEYEVIYNRYYMKLQELLGLIGGSLQFVLFFCIVISEFFNEYKLNEIIINSLVNFNNEEEKIIMQLSKNNLAKSKNTLIDKNEIKIDNKDQNLKFHYNKEYKIKYHNEIIGNNINLNEKNNQNNENNLVTSFKQKNVNNFRLSKVFRNTIQLEDILNISDVVIEESNSQKGNNQNINEENASDNASKLTKNKELYNNENKNKSLNENNSSKTNYENIQNLVEEVDKINNSRNLIKDENQSISDKIENSNTVIQYYKFNQNIN